MSGDFTRRVWRGNSVFVLGLGLPSALFASASTPDALVFALTVMVLVPLTHLISWHLESIVWPIARTYVSLVVAAVLLTGLELLLGAVNYVPSARGAWLFRALAVDALILWPVVRRRGSNGLAGRVVSASAVAVGYAVAVALLTLSRVALTAVGVSLAETLTGTLFIIALGKVMANGIRLWYPSRRPSVQEESE